MNEPWETDARNAAHELFFWGNERLKAQKILSRYFARLHAENRFLLDSVRAEQAASSALFSAYAAQRAALKSKP